LAAHAQADDRVRRWGRCPGTPPLVIYLVVNKLLSLSLSPPPHPPPPGVSPPMFGSPVTARTVQSPFSKLETRATSGNPAKGNKSNIEHMAASASQNSRKVKLSANGNCTRFKLQAHSPNSKLGLQVETRPKVDRLNRSIIQFYRGKKSLVYVATICVPSPLVSRHRLLDPALTSSHSGAPSWLVCRRHEASPCAQKQTLITTRTLGV